MIEQIPAQATDALVPGSPRKHFKDYSHDALIDLMIARPGATAKDLAAAFDRTPEWVRMIARTDAFRARFALRNAGVVNPLLEDEVKARFEAALNRSLEVLQQKLERPADQIPDGLLLKAIELGAKAGSVGGFSNAPIAPPPTSTSEERLAKLAANLTGIGASLAGGVVDVQSREIPPAPKPTEQA